MEKEVLLNEFQTSIEDLQLDKLHPEIQEQFWDFFYNVPLIQHMVSPDRKRAKDVPKDANGKIIVDVTHPHILEDMDYFRQAAIHYQKYGCYTKLRPNGNPNSEFGRWLIEEVRRCREGYVRESDGEWITGDYYYFLNYAPMQLVKKKDKNDKKGQRVFDFPSVWEGHYLKFHALNQAREHGHHYAELASRSKGKSYTAAAMLAKRFVMGESKEVNKKVTCYITADDRKYLVAGDQTLDKFQYNIDWMSNNMELPSMRLINSLSNMQWIMGYKDSDSGTNKGTLNSVIGVTSKDDPAKLRGSRGVLYVIEEFGTFPALKNLWGNLLPSVEEGEDVFGLIMAYGCCCAGTKVFDANNNLINIEDVSDSILGYDGTNTSVEDVTYLQPEAYKDCVEIVTTNGSIKCSTDHPLLALNKNIFGRSKGTCSFYRANELKKGDTLLMHGNNRFGNVNVPDAYLLGALYGDGNYSGNSCVSLSITTEEEYEYYNSHYNIGINKLRNTENGGLYAQIYFRNTHPLLKKYGMDKQSGADKKFPKNIWQWDKESIAQFLAGYFDADGNVQIVKDKHRSIKLSCKYKEPLEQVTCLLQKFGIYSYILQESKPQRVLKSTVNNTSSIVSENIGYVLYICNGDDIITFRENIPIKIQHKKNRLNSYILQKGKGRYKSLGFVYREENKKGYNFIGTQFEDLKGTKIIDIKDLGKQRIYNLTANTTHTYLSNGFISSNTAGDNDSDFGSAQELVYNPTGYHIEAFDNVYDKLGQGKRQFAYFFPGYINLANCYNYNGVSDVTKAILTILKDRFNVKYHTTDINAITKRIAEIPITPQEAMLKTRGNMFPVTQLNDRINTIDNDPTFYDNVYVGTLVQKTSGEVEFQPSFDIPIRDFPLKDNNAPGALEIYEMPQKNSEGKVFPGRYIAGHDPVDADDAETLSLTSSFILDLYTDRIVAEFTGRKEYADDNFEMLRLMCLFYNAKCCYENNKRGVFAYFSQRRCLHLLADTPEYLIDKQLIKFRGYGNSSKGIAATKPINDYANRLIREWLIKPVTITVEEDGEIVQKTVPNLSFVKNRALLKELICFNPQINVDRVRALGMAMLYRGEFVDRFEGDLSRVTNQQQNIKEDDYFSHYDTMIANFEKH